MIAVGHSHHREASGSVVIKTFLLNLPIELYIKIYKLVFDETLYELVTGAVRSFKIDAMLNNIRLLHLRIGESHTSSKGNVSS